MPPVTISKDDIEPPGAVDVGTNDPSRSPSSPPPPSTRVSQASREQLCEYPGARDNASISRRYAATFEARCQQMDALCRRLEGLTGQLAQSLASLRHKDDKTDGQQDGSDADLLQAAGVLGSMTAPLPPSHARTEVSGPEGTATSSLAMYGAAEAVMSSSADEDDGATSSSGSEDMENDVRDDDSSRVGVLVRDSYGRLRFVGGATNHMLIEAVKSLSPGGSQPAVACTPSTAEGVSTAKTDAADLEIPLFMQGSVWPDLPYLPKPEQLSRPPKYVADLLVNLYFDHLHYTFPVLFKPHFMQKYRQLLRPGPNAADTGADRGFLMVFFAVCACASSLLPGPADRRFAGIEHYEKALLLFYSATGEASLERVQCLGLLAMCAAGWNTLTQSWMLAGQAVRAAQDIGLHLSRRLFTAQPSSSGGASDILRQQIARRVWWSIYSLDRVISICLGRPMAAIDEDCDCDFPLDMSDEQLDLFARRSHQMESLPPLPPPPSATTGFIAFSRLCRIAGKIQRLHSPKRLRELASDDVNKRRRFLARIVALDKPLNTWLESLPDEIRFSANALRSGPTGTVDLTMCVIIFIVHAGSLLNLYSCINAAELVRDLVPPSHHLAFCVYYLTLSGIVLLRMPTAHAEVETLADVERCVQLLVDLEPLWPGAARGRAIVAQLLSEHRNRAIQAQRPRPSPADEEVTSGTKRSHTEFRDEQADEEALFWYQIPGSELFGFDFSDMYPLS
ncbi:hypothetical protein VTK73DRAFT_1552 [Phialemonium thermophilum]|uniref:Xylanolytic transcriptional activator regulatory domain-containing protein n=1 Tax=Phialemonium thermophilum TaxID=223376 RepID=A0ABR3X9C5_9PEZI